MTLAAARRAALAALLLIAGPAAAQRTLPSQFSTGPQPPSPNQSQGVPAPKFELPSTLPDIPPGVAIIPPSDAGRQPPATAAALPTTTPSSLCLAITARFFSTCSGAIATTRPRPQLKVSSISGGFTPRERSHS